MQNQTNIEPRNGHIILSLSRDDDKLIVLQDNKSDPTVRIVIVAIAPDVPKGIASVGDAIIGLPGSNIIELADTGLGVVHYSAIVAIDRRIREVGDN